MWWRLPTGIRSRRDRRRQGRAVFSRRQGRQPGGRGGQARRADHADRPAWQDAFGQQLRAFLAAQGVDLDFVKDTADAHTGTAIITVANADNTIVVVPGANALVECRRCRGARARKRRHCGQPVRNSAAHDRRLLQTRPCRRRDHDPQPGARDRNSAPNLLDLVDILILNETELGFLTGTELRDSDDHARFIDAARSLQSAGTRSSA